MNSARTLADRFRTQRTDRIRVDGIEVLSVNEIQLDPEEAIEIVVEQSRDDVEQGLWVHARDGELVVVETDRPPQTSVSQSDSVLIQATEPRRIELALAPYAPTDLDADEYETTGPATLQLWNTWSLGGTEHAWTGNSGIVSEALETPKGASHRVRMWCSDGLGDPQFDDLVVVITVGPRA